MAASVARSRSAMKHRLIPLTEAVPKIFLQRRRNRRIPEPRMPARIGPESVVNVTLSSRNAIAVALLRRLAVRRRWCINNHRSRMRAPGDQCKRQKHERQTQNLLHHDFPFVLRGLRSPGKGIRHRPLCCPPWEQIEQVMAARSLSRRAGTCRRQVARCDESNGSLALAVPNLPSQTCSSRPAPLCQVALPSAEFPRRTSPATARSPSSGQRPPHPSETASAHLPSRRSCAQLRNSDS